MKKLLYRTIGVYLPLAALLFIHPAAHGLSMQFVATMPSVITKGSVTQFDVFGNGIGGQIFIIILNNSGDLNSYTGLTLRYKVDFFQQGAGIKKPLYEGLSNEFTMAPNEYVPPISSTDFLKKNNPSVKVSLVTTLFSLPDADPLKKQFQQTQTIPDGRIRYTMLLEHNGNVLADAVSEHTVINATKVELVSPGASPSDAVGTLLDPHPMFLWTSDLPPYAYGADDVFELRVYKAQSGEPMAQTMNKIPVIRAGVKEPRHKAPDAGYRFIPGATYYWEVIGFLRGSSVTEVKSSPFRFRVAKQPDPAVQDVILLLRTIYGENILEKIYEYDSGVTVRIDGKTVTIEALRALVQSIQSDKYTIQSTTVQ